MNDNINTELKFINTLCTKCGNKLNGTCAIFWNKEGTNIIETICSCSNKFCNYICVHKSE